MVRACLKTVASAILADVESVLPARRNWREKRLCFGAPESVSLSHPPSGRQDAALYGGQGCLPPHFRHALNHSRKQNGSLMIELVVAMGILVVAMFPLAYTFSQERTMARNTYQRAVAMEIVDGEMEILLAGGWRAFQQGDQEYPIHADSAKNLAPGRATLTVSGKHLKLQWIPEAKYSSGAVLREADVP